MRSTIHSPGGHGRQEGRQQHGRADLTGQKRVHSLLLSFGLALILILASPLFGAGKSPVKKEATASVLRQMERDWSQAGITKDRKTMDRIMADDWISVDFQGHTITKAQALAGLKSTASQSMEPGDMKVRVFGTTAIVQGQDSSGKYAWMDVFLKRNGRWQAVASQSTKVEK